MATNKCKPGPARILCVDDNRDAADTEAELLAVMGYETRACYDGASALRAAADFAPDACLIDLNMPGMDGDELALRLRDQADGEPMLLIAVTARTDVEARVRIDAAGFHRHLVKPAALDQLLAAIDAQ
ncbi:response regulator [Limnoglobus roseus]|nr:response regulator [Limnoglobus roseus]